MSILRYKNTLRRETARQVAGKRHCFRSLPLTSLSPTQSFHCPQLGHRRVKQLKVDTQQQKSLPLSTHLEDRGDTARVSRNFTFQSETGSQGAGLCSVPAHHSQISAAASEWADGQMSGWMDGRVGGGLDAWLRRKARRIDSIKGALAASVGSDKQVRHSARCLS